jgi:hypothetical protein
VVGRGSAGACAGVNLVEFLDRGLNALSKFNREFLFEVIDDKIKQMFFF